MCICMRHPLSFIATIEKNLFEIRQLFKSILKSILLEKLLFYGPATSTNNIYNAFFGCTLKDDNIIQSLPMLQRSVAV